jgi:hypothetical protein
VATKQRQSSPVFIETPLGEYVNLARSDIQHIIKSRGFWIPEYVKRAQGYAGATRAQIQNWKRGHVMRGLGVNSMNAFDNSGRSGIVNTVMRSPLWSYGSGGVVGFEPSSVRMPSFAAGGVVAAPATSSRSSSVRRETHQKFEIVTASPKVDIDYVMRIAKIHAESGS